MKISELEILFEDKAVIVCYKPAGIATQTKRLGQQDMESLLKNYRAQKGEVPYIGIVHRLDQPVEGIMVFAKTQTAAAGLSKQIREHGIGKYYYAIAPKPKNGKKQDTLEDYLVADKKSNTTSVVTERTVQAQKAKLAYRIIDGTEPGDMELPRICQEANYALYDIALHTGRHHQIRVQFAHMGCPLLGDTRYGIRQESGENLALCSYRIEFSHPDTGKRMGFKIVPKNPAFQS